MMRYRLFKVGPPPHEAFFTMSDAMGQTLPDIQIIYAIICVNWAVTGMARSPHLVAVGFFLKSSVERFFQEVKISLYNGDD
jgi:hypothetical protein